MLNKLLLILVFWTSSYGIFEQKNTEIYSTNKIGALINIGNLKIGQSGIIVHNYNKNQSIIVSSAVVISSNDKTSTIKFINFDDLMQNAIPNTKLKPKNKDIFILNYLYKKSLLITPNGESYNNIKNKLPKQNFLNSDIFAAYLKLESNPTPTKKDFLEFCTVHNLGTIYIVIDKKLYIVDAKSFKIINTQEISYKSKTNEKPFYTKIDKITKGTFSWFEEESIGNYNEYYKNILDLK
jgi:hypothetical protein